MKYIEGIKYYLAENETIQTNIYPSKKIVTKFGTWDVDGKAELYRGWVWDGCSGPTIDDKTNMRAGAWHDFGYYLIRAGLLAPIWKPLIDELFYEILLEDTEIVKKKCPFYKRWFYGTTEHIRPHAYYWAVSKFGDSSTKPENERPVLEAP